MVAMVLLPRELSQVPPPVGVVGHKARGLCRLQALKARVPRFGVVTAQAFDAFVGQRSLKDALKDAERADLKDEATLHGVADSLVQKALQTPLPAAIRDGLDELTRAFADEDLLAVRASIVGNDAEARALTGALDAALATRDLEACVQRLYSLAFHARTLQARAALGLPPLSTRLAVVIQRFIASEQSGLCLSLDVDADAAANHHRLGRQATARVRSCFGLAGGLGGRGGNSRIITDDVVVIRPAVAEDGLPDDAQVQLSPRKKTTALRRDDDKQQGTRMVPLAETQQVVPSLSTVQSRLVVKEALRLEAAFGRPQAISFAYAGRLLHILDVEPLLLPKTRVSSERVRVWDERLVPLALAQPTSTLSFSVWQRGVARGFERAGRLFGVRGVVLEESRPLFRRCLGLVTGRMTGSVDVMAALLDLLPFAEKARQSLARATGQAELGTLRDGDHLAAGFGGGKERGGRSLWDRARQKIDESRWPGQLERLSQVADGESLAFITQVDEVLAPLGAVDLQAADPDVLLDTFERLEESLARVVAALTLSGTLASLWQGELRRVLEELKPTSSTSTLPSPVAPPGSTLSLSPPSQASLFHHTLIADEPSALAARCGDPLAGPAALLRLVATVERSPRLRQIFGLDATGKGTNGANGANGTSSASSANSANGTRGGKESPSGGEDSPLDDDAILQALHDESDVDIVALRAGLTGVVDVCDGVYPEGRLLLEEARLQEHPARLVGLLRQLLSAPRTDLDARRRVGIGQQKKADYALEQSVAALPGLQVGPMRKRLALARDHARAHTDAFARLWLPAERVVFHLRRVTLALGERLFEHGLLDHPGDVFLLQDAELAGVIRGTGPDVDVRPLVMARRRAAATRPPASGRRVETRGIVATSLLSDDDQAEDNTAPGADDGLAGHSAGAGRAQGSVWHLGADVDANEFDVGLRRHLEDAPSAPDGAPDRSRALIAVAQNPQLFDLALLATAGGAVFERGSADGVVAHSLRRLGLPVVVEVPSASVRLKGDEEVVVDAVAGTVTRAARMSRAEQPKSAAVPAELFLREAIATDPAGLRPFDDDGRAHQPGSLTGAMPMPPGAGFFRVPPVAGMVSDEGAPVDDEMVVDSSAIDEEPA